MLNSHTPTHIHITSIVESSYEFKKRRRKWTLECLNDRCKWHDIFSKTKTKQED